MIKKNSTRVMVNTGAQYVRTVVNIILSLYSTRLILNTLGIEDYGLFTLVAGVVSMLSFMTNAMVTTTQRFLSYHQAKSSIEELRDVFSNSVLMHVMFAVVILIILEIAGLFLFDGFLNIEADRKGAAEIVYQCAVMMILTSFITAPFKALIISHENIVYISVIDILDGVLKVLVAIFLTYISYDKLIFYGFLMYSIYIINLLAFSVYDFRKYSECVMPRIRTLNYGVMKKMSSFVGWQLYSSGCIIGRTQGTAVILNKLFGTTINAAFGIALQISGSINFISNSLILAINPQIVKAEGAGDREKMFRLSEIASKFSFLLLSVLVIPLCIIMPDVLKLWLGSNVPENTVLFCRVILITALIDQITFGLGSANQAIGNIKEYALSINSLKIITLIPLYLLLISGVQIGLAIWTYPLFELLCALARLIFLHRSGGLVIKTFVRNVFYKVPVPFFFLLVCYGVCSYSEMPLLGVIGLGVIFSFLYLVIIYRFSLNNYEKDIMSGILTPVIRKIKYKNASKL